jgi:hypothetical protein
MGGLAAVHRDLRSADPGGLVGDEEYDQRGDVIGGAAAPERDLVHDHARERIGASSAIGVTITPGRMVLTRIPWRPSSMLATREMPRSPHLLAV